MILNMNATPSSQESLSIQTVHKLLNEHKNFKEFIYSNFISKFFIQFMLHKKNEFPLVNRKFSIDH